MTSMSTILNFVELNGLKCVSDLLWITNEILSLYSLYFCVNKCSGYPLSKNTYLYEQAVDDEWIHW